jgi:hypothetical protein
MRIAHGKGVSFLQDNNYNYLFPDCIHVQKTTYKQLELSH